MGHSAAAATEWPSQSWGTALDAKSFGSISQTSAYPRPC